MEKLGKRKILNQCQVIQQQPKRPPAVLGARAPISTWKRERGERERTLSACCYRRAANWCLGWHRTVTEGCPTYTSWAELTRQKLFLGFQSSVSRLAVLLALIRSRKYASLSSWSVAWAGSRWACFLSGGISCPHLQNKYSFSRFGSSLPISLGDLNALCWISCRHTLQRWCLNMASHMFQQFKLYFPWMYWQRWRK